MGERLGKARRIGPRGARTFVIVVIARSPCDEAIHTFLTGKMDCFASLAMTVWEMAQAAHSNHPAQ
jgi:hypothetical protein